MLNAIFTIVWKDLRAELRSRRLISAVGLFALIAVLIFYYTLEGRRDVLTGALPSILWVIVVFAGILGLSRSLSAEHERGTLDALLLAPIPRAALFYGKFIGNWLFSLIVAVIVAAALTILFNVWLFDPALWLVVLLGTIGFSAVGTLTGSIAIHADGRETTLPILVLPIALPVIISSVRATTDILNGLPFADWSVWLPALISVDAIFLILAFVLFDFIVEE
jgi:heme exporter protein B